MENNFFTLRQLKEMNTIQPISGISKEIEDFYNKMKIEDFAIDFFLNEGVIKTYNKSSKNIREQFTDYIYFKFNEKKKNTHISNYVYKNYEFFHVFSVDVNIERLIEDSEYGNKNENEYEAIVTDDKFLNDSMQDYINLEIQVFISTFVYLTHLMRDRNTIIKCIEIPRNEGSLSKAKTNVSSNIKKKVVKLDFDTIKYELTLDEESYNFMKKHYEKHYERHTLGWTVRGHWRHYQSGKNVWIKPQVRGDKDKVEGKIYEI